MSDLEYDITSCVTWSENLLQRSNRRFLCTCRGKLKLHMMLQDTDSYWTRLAEKVKQTSSHLTTTWPTPQSYENFVTAADMCGSYIDAVGRLLNDEADEVTVDVLTRGVDIRLSRLKFVPPRLQTRLARKRLNKSVPNRMSITHSQRHATGTLSQSDAESHPWSWRFP